MKPSLVSAAQKALNYPSMMSKKPIKRGIPKPIRPGMTPIKPPRTGGPVSPVTPLPPKLNPYNPAGKEKGWSKNGNMKKAAQTALLGKKRQKNIKKNPDAFNASGKLKNSYHFTKGDGIKGNPEKYMKK